MIVTVASAMLIYSLAIIPVLQRREKIRPIARELEQIIPPNEILYAVDPEYQPYLFYFRKGSEPSPIRYVSQVSDLPRSARFILVQPENEHGMEQSTLWNPLRPRVIREIEDYRGRRVIVFEIKGAD